MVGDHLVQPIIACIGFPVAGNPTQFVCERTLNAMGLDWGVVTAVVPAEMLEQAVLGARAMRFGGLAVLPPHQEVIATHLDTLSPASQKTGIVQVVRRMEEVWYGHDLRAETLLTWIQKQSLDDHHIALWLADAKLLDAIQELDSKLSRTMATWEGWKALADRVHESTEAVAEETPEPKILPDVGCVIVDASTMDPGEYQKSKIQWRAQGTVLVADATIQATAWKKWALDRQWQFLGALDYQSHLIAKMLEFWTQSEPPVAHIRDLLEEYLEW
ncbi:MAG: hypothetical protein U0905_04360 [Pirellulales bacterium]